MATGFILTFKGDLVGMHTDDDATFILRNHKIDKDNFGIIDVLPTVLDLMNIDGIDKTMFDGQSLI